MAGGLTLIQEERRKESRDRWISNNPNGAENSRLKAKYRNNFKSI